MHLQTATTAQGLHLCHPNRPSRHREPALDPWGYPTGSYEISDQDVLDEQDELELSALGWFDRNPDYDESGMLFGEVQA